VGFELGGGLVCHALIKFCLSDVMPCGKKFEPMWPVSNLRPTNQTSRFPWYWNSEIRNFLQILISMSL
jgi:hypothetical protein